ALPQNWGKGALAAWLPNGLQGVMGPSPALDGGNFVGLISPQGVSTGWTIDYLVNGRTDYFLEVGHTGTVGSTDSWTLSGSPSISSIPVTPPAGSTGGGGITYIQDGLFHHIRFQVIENFIGDANYAIYVDGVLIASGHVTATSPEPVIDVLY